MVFPATTRPVSLAAYTTGGLIETDPFISLDQEGVGELIEIAATRGPRHAV